MTIHIENRQKKIKLDRRRIRQSAQKILKTLEMKEKEVSLVFMDNAGIQEINRDYLHRDRPTNVISFAIGEGEFSGINPDLLGDVIISVERAMDDAQAGNLPFEDELDFLIIHGLLHLIGYDHEGGGKAQAARMKEKEQELFQALRGYPLDLA